MSDERQRRKKLAEDEGRATIKDSRSSGTE